MTTLFNWLKKKGPQLKAIAPLVGLFVVIGFVLSAPKVFLTFAAVGSILLAWIYFNGDDDDFAI